MFLFLVDRTKTKFKWWTYDWSEAMQFHKESAAMIQSNKLRYKNPTVITIDEAIRMSKLNDVNFDYKSQEHPFSSEALGQD